MKATSMLAGLISSPHFLRLGSLFVCLWRGGGLACTRDDLVLRAWLTRQASRIRPVLGQPRNLAFSRVGRSPNPYICTSTCVAKSSLPEMCMFASLPVSRFLFLAVCQTRHIIHACCLLGFVTRSRSIVPSCSWVDSLTTCIHRGYDAVPPHSAVKPRLFPSIGTPVVTLPVVVRLPYYPHFILRANIPQGLSSLWSAARRREAWPVHSSA